MAAKLSNDVGPPQSLGDVLKSLGRDLANLALTEVKSSGVFGLFGFPFGGGARPATASPQLTCA